MLEDSIFTNRVTKEQLSKKFPNKVNIGFGLDANKIKGVDNFPIYREAVEFNSNARSNIDTYMFTSRQRKYDVVVPKHTSSVGEIQPYYYNKHRDSLSTESNIWMEPGKMSSLYGLPPDRDIIIENPTAMAMNMMGGQMTEEKMMNHIARKEVSSTASGSSSDFFNDPRLISIIEGSTPVVDDSVPMQETSVPAEPERVTKSSRPAARQEDEIIVEPAFKKGIQTEPENKSVHSEPENKNKNSRPEDDEVVAMKKKKSDFDFNIGKSGKEDIEKLLNQLRDEAKGKYRNIHKEISSKMVAMGYAKPDAKIQINENFVTRVKKIMGDTYLNKGRILTEGQSQQLNFLIAQGNENDSRKKSSIGTSEIIVEDMHFEKTP